jgi:CMP-N-acetylneuraminic acid synthetase
VNILGIIPARGGSKGIPLKNLQKVAGKPLIEYTISSAKNSKKISRLIVSTDNEKIANVSKKLGAEVPFLRPKKFATDKSSQLDVIKHTLDFLKNEENYTPDIITILHPTNPLRKTTKIDKSINMLIKSKADIVLGVVKVKTHPFRSFWNHEGLLKPFKKDFLKFYQRQLYPPLFYPMGDIYTFWYNTYKKYGVIYGPKIKPLFNEKNEIVLDIDNYFDLFLVEKTILELNKLNNKVGKINKIGP